MSPAPRLAPDPSEHWEDNATIRCDINAGQVGTAADTWGLARPIEADGGFHLASTIQRLAPGGTVQIALEPLENTDGLAIRSGYVRVSSLDYAQSLMVDAVSPTAIAAGNNPVAWDGAMEEAIGADLSLSVDHKAIASAAGGVFYIEVWLQFTEA